MNRAARHEGVKALQLKFPTLLPCIHITRFCFQTAPYFAASNYHDNVVNGLDDKGEIGWQYDHFSLFCFHRFVIFGKSSWDFAS